MRKIPQYTIDGEAVYVPRDDDAWDVERIEKEAADLPEGERHPVHAYWDGDTRYRLETVLPWLDMDKRPEQWVIEDRRFPPFARREAAALELKAARLLQEGEQDLAFGAWARAMLIWARYGIRDVRNFPLKIDRQSDGGLSDRFMSDLDRIAPHLLVEVGQAASKANAPLTEAEGK